jgi:hypothetical protein
MRPLLPAPEPPTIAIIIRSCRLDREAPDFTLLELSHGPEDGNLLLPDRRR